MDVFWLEHANDWLIAVRCLKRRVAGHLGEGVILSVRVDDQDAGTILRLHELLDDNGSQVALSRTGRSENRQVSRREVAASQDDRNRVRASTQQ